MDHRIAFTSSSSIAAQTGFEKLTERYGNCAPQAADVIVALGGDGFMLQTLHASQKFGLPVYGMNRGTVGFLMNPYQEDDLLARITAAEETAINPLRMQATDNYSAHGPILPIGADVLAMTALNAFRPRRWRGALLPKKAHVRFEVMDPEKRPVMADADSTSISNVAIVDITSEEHVQHRLLFDPGHGLDERLLQEQFV